jgi:hypothetical protein
MTAKAKKIEKSNVIALPVPVLTRPQGVTGGKGTAKAELRGHEQVVDRIIAIKQEAENLEAEEKLLREPVQRAAMLARQNLEAQTGKTIKSVVAHGTHQDARFTWANAYRAAGIEHEPALRGCLGPFFDSLFETTFSFKVRDRSAAGSRAVVDELRRALRGRFDVLFEVAPEIRAKDELMEKRTTLKTALTAAQNTALDLVLEQLQSQPRLNTK